MRRTDFYKMPGVWILTAVSVACWAGWQTPVLAQTGEEPEVFLMETDLELDHEIEAVPQPMAVTSTYEKGEEALPVENEEALQPAAVEDVNSQAEEPAARDVITGAEILRTSRALRQAIEQNKKLLEQNHQFEEQLRILRGQNRLDRSRAVALQGQLQQLNTETEDIFKVKERYDEKINQLSERMQIREDELNKRIQDLEAEMVKQEELAKEQRKYLTYEELGITKDELDSMNVPQEKIAETLSPSSSGLDVVTMISEMEATQAQIREDEARLHYNMGNIFFHQGDYEQAADEYKKVLELNPADASAHFNLAFVCGDYLKDFPAAIRHYEQYLYLNPKAEDSPLVQEKVLEAKLYVRTQIKDMKMEKEAQEDFGKTYAW